MELQWAEMQQTMATSSHRSPEVPEEQTKRAEAQAETRVERPATVEEAVSKIMDELQQPAISTGGRQPTKAPAATGGADLEARLHRAAKHFARQSSGSPIAPAHAPASLLASPQVAPVTGSGATGNHAAVEAATQEVRAARHAQELAAAEAAAEAQSSDRSA